MFGPVRLLLVMLYSPISGFSRMLRYAWLLFAAYENWMFDGPRLLNIVL